MACSLCVALQTKPKAQKDSHWCRPWAPGQGCFFGKQLCNQVVFEKEKDNPGIALQELGTELFSFRFFFFLWMFRDITYFRDNCLTTLVSGGERLRMLSRFVMAQASIPWIRRQRHGDLTFRSAWATESRTYFGR